MELPILKKSTTTSTCCEVCSTGRDRRPRARKRYCLCRWPLRLSRGCLETTAEAEEEEERAAMYSSVAAQHNYKGGGEKRINRQQSQQQLQPSQASQQQEQHIQVDQQQPQQQQQQQQQQQGDEQNNQEENGTSSKKHSSRHHHHHHHQSLTTRLFNYIKQQFHPEKGPFYEEMFAGKKREEELDEFNIHVARHRPEELAKLTKTTKFTRKEIQLIYRGFKQECPTGMVDEDSFKNIFSQFFPQGDASQYAHYVFNTIKHNQTGKISFEDFLGILSKVSRGSVQEKLQWIFGLYDLNGDGLITKNEMLDVVTSIYEMLGRSTEPVVEEHSAKEHVEKIFHQIDTNKDGVVTIDELVEWCSRDEQILQSLETLDTVL